MWYNYIKVAFRNLLKNGFYSFINIFGLAIGLACCLLILLFVRNEYSFDSFHTNADRLYRVVEDQHYSNGNIYSVEATPGPLAPALVSEVPQIENAARLSWKMNRNLFSEGKAYKADGCYADPALLQMFSLEMLSGHASNALSDISSVIISERLALILFNSTDVVGRSLRVENKDDVQISGVFRDLPANSSLLFDFLLPYELYIKTNSWLEDWGNNGIRTFVMLHEQASPEQTKVNVKNFLIDRKAQENARLYLQPIKDMHLYSEFKQGKNTSGPIVLVQLFSGIAVFLMIIACINFTNLSTARAGRRSREVGVRKAIGAYPEQLVGQFLGESILVSLLAALLAVLMAQLVLPGFNSLTGLQLHIPYTEGKAILVFVFIVLLTALLAGSYPAFMLSSFNTLEVIKGRVSPGKGSILFRKGLVVFQFFISIILIVSTLVVSRQIYFMKNKDMGINMENLLMLEMNSELEDSFNAFKADVMQSPGVARVTAASHNPLFVGSNSSEVKWPGKSEDDEILFQQLYTDADFVPAFGVKLLEGRNFREGSKADTANFILNETAVRMMRLPNPLETEIEAFGRKGKIIGIARDFHTTSVHKSMSPCIILLQPENKNVAFVKLNEAGGEDAYNRLTASWQQYSPSYPLTFSLLKDAHQDSYKMETLVGKLTAWFSLLAVFISCLGLFGLAAFTTEQRRKEIGIRKVLGASAIELVIMLSAGFTRWVGLAFLLAAPVSYFLMEMLLRNFSYRVEVGLFSLIIAGAIAFVLAIITVGYLSFKAARLNPALTLKED